MESHKFLVDGRMRGNKYFVNGLEVSKGEFWKAYIEAETLFLFERSPFKEIWAELEEIKVDLRAINEEQLKYLRS